MFQPYTTHPSLTCPLTILLLLFLFPLSVLICSLFPPRQELRKKYGKRKIDPSKQYVWECKDLTINVTNIRPLTIPPPIMADFVQATVRIETSQRLRVLDKQGNLVA